MITFWFKVVNTLGFSPRFQLVAKKVPSGFADIPTLGDDYSKDFIEASVRNGFRVVIIPAQEYEPKVRMGRMQFHSLPSYGDLEIDCTFMRTLYEYQREKQIFRGEQQNLLDTARKSDRL